MVDFEISSFRILELYGGTIGILWKDEGEYESESAFP